MAKRLLTMLILAAFLASAAGPAVATRHAAADRGAGLSGYVLWLMDLAQGSIFGARISLFARDLSPGPAGSPCDPRADYPGDCTKRGHHH